MRTAVVLLAICALGSSQTLNRGYYRYPAISGQTIVFTAEGDLWQVGLEGGIARRLTSHPGAETQASFSPDGKTVAFAANYEGPTEIYTMTAGGGLPVRRTLEGNVAVVGWTPDGKILYSTRRFSAMPDNQLATIDAQNRVEVIPLSQAAQGVYDRTGKTLFFTRLPFQGSASKRYEGGTAQNLWKYTEGKEAVALTGDFNGTSKNAMWWNGRVYFLSDRDGTMNLWSMDENGKSLKQHTKHQGWDLKTAALSEGRVVYQMGADLRLYDIAANSDKALNIELSSDFDHLREHWITSPLQYASGVHVAPDGGSVVITSRGRSFVAPVKQGRFVDIAAHKPGRYRDAVYLPDGKNLLLLSTESGEVELWKAPANGSGPAEQLTKDGKVLRWDAAPSPDGKWIAHQDKDNQLWLFNTATKDQKKIASAETTDDSSPAFEAQWSPDSRWIAWSVEVSNTLNRIMLYNVESGVTTPLTTDRYNNWHPAWGADGKWIYFVSDRWLHTVVQAPWGSRQPEPFFDRTDKIYAIALRKGQRSPFDPPDELHPDKPAAEPPKPATDTPKPGDTTKPGDAPKPGDGSKPAEPAKPADPPKPAADAPKPGDPPKVEIDLDGLEARLEEVPVPQGNFSNLMAVGKRLCWTNVNATDPSKRAVECLDIANKGDKPDTVMDDARLIQVTPDGKKMLIGRGNDLFVVDSTVRGAALRDPKTLSDSQVDLRNWTFSVIPSDEFKEEFLDAWRLHRDYFYDRNMHGVNWKAMRDKFGELVPRVRDREELNDLISEMVSELSTLHQFVRGGDIRRGTEQVGLSSLGAALTRDKEQGGYVVSHIYRNDPDRPDQRGPLAKSSVDIVEGDVLLAINGRDLMSVSDPADLLRNQTGKQVLVKFRPKGKTETKEAIVKPVSMAEDANLRYSEWEYTRRLAVEKASSGKFGYVHLRAMGPNDINTWVEQYSPVFDREGLIVDVRHNGGGNIDSWILGRLMRKAWMYWQPRVGHPYWNMQQAFRGYVVVLCDQGTGSDGEAFAEGFRRLGLGKVIGMRTWGGEIWLSSSNFLADRGIATTGENGVFGPERKWLIEGHGVDPDIVVDNPPHATFEGQDAQLDAAIKYLQDRLREKPLDSVKPPDYPDKTWKGTKGGG